MIYPKMTITPQAWIIGEAFLKALLLEVSAYPKPGLVTSRSNGSHQDMNVLTFMVGSASVAPTLFLCAQAGMDHEGEYTGLLPSIREIGVSGEQRLLFGTKGVNTQRGALFAAGILCGAAGYVSRTNNQLVPEDILDVAAAMTKGIVKRELVDMNATGRNLTPGEQLFLKYQVRGIRGEVEDGFPSVKNAGLPAFRDALANELDLNLCLVHTLVSLMTCVEDTTVLWRKDMDTLKEVQEKAREIIALGSVFTNKGIDAINELDEQFIQANISPGGSADLVSITAGLYLLENYQFPVKIL